MDDVINSVQEDLATASQAKVKRPKMFKVYLHNDDFTPMEFVVMVLMDVFHKDLDEASFIMLTVHHKGGAVCGRYPKAVAETKVQKVMTMAREAGHPLLCTMKPE